MILRPALVLALLLLCTACGGEEEAVGDLVGVYLLDGDRLAQDFLRLRLDRLDGAEREGLTPQDRRVLLAEVRAAAALSDVRLDLIADGTFVVRYRYDGDEGRRRGMWRRAGSVIALRTTHSTAGPLAKPRVVEARVGEGALSFLADDDVPHPFTLKRR